MDASRIVSQSRPATQLTAEQSARLREFADHFGAKTDETQAPLKPTSTQATRRALNARHHTNGEAKTAIVEDTSALQSPAPVTQIGAIARTPSKRRR